MSMTKPVVQIGIVGAGSMGNAYAQAFSGLSKIYDIPVVPVLEFVTDINEDLARTTAERYGFNSGRQVAFSRE